MFYKVFKFLTGGLLCTRFQTKVMNLVGKYLCPCYYVVCFISFHNKQKLSGNLLVNT